MATPSYDGFPTFESRLDENVLVAIEATSDMHVVAFERSWADRIYSQPGRRYFVNYCQPMADPRRAVAVLYPFGVGDTGRMRSELSFVQQSQAVPSRLMGFPNTSKQKVNQHLSHPELVRLQTGDFDILAASIVDTLNNEYIETVDIIGLEQGASIAERLPKVAYAVGGVSVRSLTLIEPPNVIRREDEEDVLNDIKLFADKRHVRDMLEEHHLTNFGDLFPEYVRGPLKRLHEKSRILADLDSASTEGINRHILRGLVHGGFGKDLESSPPVPTVLARGERSPVCPNFDCINPTNYSDVFTVAGRGKELIYDPVKIAQLAGVAMRRAT